MDKALKSYRKAIEPHGLKLEKGTKHFKVTKNGHTVATVSKTGESNALRQSIRDLARLGLVPDSTRRLKF